MLISLEFNKNSIKILPIEYIIYLFPDIGPQTKKFTIYPMKNSLKKIPLSGVFTVK